MRLDRRRKYWRTLKDLYDGYAADPYPPEWLDNLDRPILTLSERPR